MVSHVNDFGQTRGSRYLTKVSDITINLARDTQAEDPTERRRVVFSIPYNRFSSHSGPAGSALFDIHTYSYTEDAVNDNDRQDHRRTA
jgi:hypothetical protein